ncbi:MAG: hypothetical protein MUF64_30955 [Polyangiaceae bacterium]|nr:hypothetical protein [Polyangiaceae bacterium]
MSPPDDREQILRRRAQFLAALVGASVAGEACSNPTPQVCLSPPVQSVEPTPSATVAPSASSAATVPSGVASAPAPEGSVMPGSSAPRPQICLSPPPPRPCLSVRPPDRNNPGK